MAPTTEETGAAVAEAQAALDKAQAAHAESTAAAAEPRAPEAIVTHLFDKLVMRLGNRPELRKLVDELQTATAPKA